MRSFEVRHELSGHDLSIEQARLSLNSGNLIKAYAIAKDLNGTEQENKAARYLEVLALARMGDTVQALKLYDEHDIGSFLNSDSLSLKARLLKDEALKRTVPDRIAIRRAAQSYLMAYRQTGDLFPLINAATLAAASGKRASGQRLASRVLRDGTPSDGSGYWNWITVAEAQLILGAPEEAMHAARISASQPDASPGARSSTIRQFERLIPLIGDNPALEEILALLRPPPIVHYCGHIFASDHPHEGELAEQVDTMLARNAIAVGYGALAAGSDILIAERLLARGAELHVILPFSVTDFRHASVLPAGAGWEKRFDACLDAANTITVASDMAYVNDPRQFSYGAEVAMGMAVLRAEHLAGKAMQLAIWDGASARGLAGTAVDVATWTSTGRTSCTIGFQRPRGPLHSGDLQTENQTGIARGAHSILFADFSGFSKISEDRLLLFWTNVMGTIARVVSRFSDSLLCKNTWGDALYLVIEGADSAAELALCLQEAISVMDLEPFGGTSSGMRIALHYGTMFRADDPVTGMINFFGSEVSRAARLEPVTPKHSVYVSESFAAVLALRHSDRYAVHYVGDMPLAKNYGSKPVYRLDRRVGPESDAASASSIP